MTRPLIPPNVREVALDCESSGLYADDGARVSCLAVAWPGGSLTLDLGQEANVPERAHLLWKQILRELRSKLLIFHNAKFDLSMMAAGTTFASGVDLSPWLFWDTMLCARVREPQQSAGLDAVGSRLGFGGKSGDGEVKAWLKAHKKPKGRYDLVPWEIIEPYVRQDAELTIQIYLKQRQSLLRGADLKWFELEMKLCRVLFAMEQRGVGYSRRKSLTAKKELEKKQHEVEAQMPFAADITSAKAYFFKTAGLAPDRRSEKTGAPSLDKEQIRDWAHAGVPWAKEYKFVNFAKRAISMWYHGYVEKLGDDGRLRPNYKQSTVVSGRLSTGRVNLQAMPRSVEEGVNPRQLLTVRKGYELWNLDLSQAELRVAASYAKCGRMLDMLAAGTDLHSETAKQIMKAKESNANWKERRQVAKNLNFAAIYGVGGYKFSRMLANQADIHYSVEKCERLVRAWHNFYPQIRPAYLRANHLFETRGWVKLLLGTEYERKSYCDRVPTSGFNRMVQGSIALFVRLWLIEIEREWPGMLVLTVHDSVMLEIPKEKKPKKIVTEIAEMGCDFASSLFRTNMPIDTERYK